MEEKIILIGVRKIISTKKQKDYYMVDYIKRRENIYTPCTDYITIEEYNGIARKMKGNVIEVTGIFKLNEYNKGYLADIK